MASPKTGFSLIELIVVLAITSILIVFAAPTYHGFQERNRSKIAAAKLVNIYHAQKRYRLENGGFFVVKPATSTAPAQDCANTACDATVINSNLGLDIPDRVTDDFSYALLKVGTGTGATWEVVATRNATSSACPGSQLSIDSRSTAVSQVVANNVPRCRWWEATL